MLQRLERALQRQRPAYRKMVGGNRNEHALSGKNAVQRQHTQHGATIDQYRPRRIITRLHLKPQAKAVEDVRPLAEQRVDFHQLRVRGDELRATAPREHHRAQQLGQGLAFVIEREQAFAAAWHRRQNATQMGLGIEIEQ